MKRTLAALALALGLSVGVLAPAQADDCPLTVAGECVSQPVADYVLGQQQTIADLMASNATAYASLRAEQAAHNETRLLLTEAQAHGSYLQTELAGAQVRLVRKQLTIERLRAQLRAR